MFKLVIQDDEGKTTVVPLIRDEITIGRKEGNTIRLTERNVSRRHARILRQNGEVQIEDLGSYNGIRVNNARIAERVSLRVSDQVQIGDYKLYLKAEGVEQVDDARTMPIERVDTANTATDVIAAVAVPPPTQPMAIQTPAPGTLPPAAQLIGNPNRTQVAVADTDPQGRPVASAAQVAAVLSSPAGYGKLVVLSSNFAGKEFELSRPQMIIGRTDENDIVINHRSISRNHAKLVREPDTSRYTISDLQSSNGVRVNGQDYGKVELRRGDVVDLGHVRLRFVESGEDFVFSRDAVITDVPDSGSKRGVYIAGAVAMAVLIGIVVYFAFIKKSGNTSTTNGSNNVAFADAGTQVAVAPDADGIDNPADATVAADDPVGRLRLQCTQAQDAKKWDDLITCATSLKGVDKPSGDKFYATAHAEQKAEAALRKLEGALGDKALGKAHDALGEINEDSVYRKDAEAKYGKLADVAKDDISTRLKKANKGDCKNYNAIVRQERSTKPGDIVDAAVKDAGICTAVAIKDPVKDPIPPKPDPCDKYEELTTKGSEAFSANRAADALAAYEAAYRCRKDGTILKYTFGSACKAKRVDKARVYWKLMNQAAKDAMLSICANNGIYEKDLNP